MIQTFHTFYNDVHVVACKLDIYDTIFDAVVHFEISHPRQDHAALVPSLAGGDLDQ